METRRVFLAMPVTPSVRQALEDVQADTTGVFGPRGRVHPDAFHLTLRFLGDVPSADIDELSDAVRAQLRDMNPLQLRLKGVTSFGPLDAPRVVVVTVEPEKPVAAIATQIEQVVTRLGYRSEKRPFRAHITIHRPKKPGRIRPRTLSGMDAFPVDRVVLYESQLRPDRAHYMPVAVFPLGGQHDGGTV